MAEQDFRKLQYAFAAHLRNPEANPAPSDIEDRRLTIYRDLFFNNMVSLLAGTFPVLHRILGIDRWRELVRDFYHRHQSHTPLFMEVPQEFLAYLQTELDDPARWPAFIHELAHYEWVELAASIAEEDDIPGDIDPDGDLLSGIPVLSAVVYPLAYRFPVHQISPEFQPEQPGDTPTFLIVYRKPDDSTGFVEINGITARLIELLADNDSASCEQLLRIIAEEIAHPDPEQLVAAGRDIFVNLKAADILRGVRTS